MVIFHSYVMLVYQRVNRVIQSTAVGYNIDHLRRKAESDLMWFNQQSYGFNKWGKRITLYHISN